MNRRLRLLLTDPPIRRLALAVTILMLANLVVLFAYTLPETLQASALEAEVAAAREHARDQRQAQQVAAAYDRARTLVAQIDARLAQDLSQGTLVAHLARIARTSKLRITGESYAEERPTAAYAGLLLSLQLEGSYAALRAFLDRLDEVPAWLEIDETTVERTRTPGIIKAQLRLRVIRRVGEGT